VYCTPSLAKKAVVGLTLFALTAKALRYMLEYLADVHILVDVYIIVFNVVVPVTVLVINVMVVHEVRRASNSAAHLGHQQSVQQQSTVNQQSTSSNSAVPTVMLLATSLIYSILCGTCSFLYIATRSLPLTAPNHESEPVLRQVNDVAFAWRDLIFAYNFFVYLITGKQFRSELRRLFCFCRSAATTVSATDSVRSSRRDQAVTEF